jgi:hypothetical protein
MLGVYFETGGSTALPGVPAPELTDQVIGLDALWGTRGAHLAEDLARSMSRVGSTDSKPCCWIDCAAALRVVQRRSMCWGSPGGRGQTLRQ